MNRTKALILESLLTVLVAGRASAQEAADSLAVSTADSLLEVFSPYSVRLPAMGKRTAGTDSLSLLHSTQFERTDALSMDQVFGRLGDFFVWDLGEPGKDSQLLFRGMDWRSIAMTVDAIPLNDPLTGAFNLFDLPIEFFDDVEVVSSAQGMIAPTASPAATVNAVSHQYLSYRPVTKIRFLQGPYGQVFTDGLFTQNVARTTNLLVGFQRHSTDGRYPNGAYDSWNFRSRLRSDLSSRFNIAVTYLYTKRVTGMNGGVFIDSTRTIFEAAGATVRFQEATETLWRHDVALQALAAPFADTTLLTKATIYYTLHERDYRDYESPIYSTPAVDRTNVWGAHLEQELSLLSLRAVIGGDLQFKDVTASPHVGIRQELTGTVWGRAGLKLFGLFEPRAQAREDFFDGNRHASYGAGVAVNEGGPWELSVDAALLWRLPTLQERYWTSPLVTRLNKIVPEKHRLLEATVRARPWKGTEISASAYRRQVENGVVFIAASPAAMRSTGVNILSVPRLNYQGVSIDALLSIWKFAVRVAGSFTEYKEQDTIKTLLPSLKGVVDLSFRDIFFKDHLDLKVGLRVQGVTRHRGMEFVPPMLAYVENRGEEVGKFASMDLYGSFQLGDAVVTLAWANIFDINYYVTPVYPMLDRSISLGVNWRFLD